MFLLFSFNLIGIYIALKSVPTNIALGVYSEGIVPMVVSLRRLKLPKIYTKPVLVVPLTYNVIFELILTVFQPVM